MKFSAVLAFVAAATVVSASTNAERFARGLGPKAPVRRATPVERARRGSPSGTPSKCSTGPVQCCDSVTNGNNQDVETLAGLLGLVIPANVPIGLGCSPITVGGIGSGADCTSQTVCCDNNEFNGLINIGCSPININL